MKKIVKTIFFNILVLLAMLMLVEMCSVLILNNRSEKEVIIDFNDKRGLLPNYKGVDWGELFFKEYAELESEYRSYYGWRRLPYRGKTINIDSSGLRKTVQQNGSDSLSLAVFLGGSTIWGTGVSDEYTIPSLFANDSKWNYKAINYGESAYTAYQGLQFLQLKVIEGVKPQIVVSYDGVNNSPVRIKTPYSHKREKQIKHKMKGADRIIHPNPKLLTSTRILMPRMLSSFRNKMANNSVGKEEFIIEIPVFTAEQNRAAAIELLESWLQMDQLCNQMGAEFYCVLQPNPFVGKPDTTNFYKTLNHHRYYQNGYEYYNDVFQLLDSNRYISLKKNFIDLTQSLNEKQHVYIDFCHLSPNGNKVIADLLLEKIARKQLDNQP